MKKKTNIQRNIKIIPSQSGIFFRFMTDRSGEKSIVRKPEKNNIASTEPKL